MRVIASRSVGAPVPLTDHYEAVVCDLCGSPAGRVLARIPSIAAVADPLQRFCLDGLEFPGGGISLVRCPSCGFGYQNPRLSEEGMRVFYTRFYDPAGPGEAYHRTPQPDLDAARYRAIAATGRTSGTVLDVGAGKGYALEAFPAPDWQRHGLDVSREALETLRERLPDAIVHEGSLSDRALAEGSVDVLTMNSTLEHLRDPVDTLQAARRVLKPHGLLVFNVPNLRCGSRILARALGEEWIGFTPEHLNYFSVGVLSRLAREVGFARSSHHTVSYRQARPRWAHLAGQSRTVASGLKRVALRRPGGKARLATGLGIAADWPFSSTGLGRRLTFGENITGLWES